MIRMYDDENGFSKFPNFQNKNLGLKMNWYNLNLKILYFEKIVIDKYEASKSMLSINQKGGIKHG